MHARHAPAFSTALFPQLITAILLLLVPACETAPDSNPAWTLDGVPLIEAQVPPDRWAELRANRWSDERVPVALYIDGARFRGTLEAQGAGSRYHARWSFKLTMDGDDTLFGFHEMNLSAQIYDPSHLRSTLATEAFAALGFPVFAHRHIFLRVNGTNLGLYLLVERVNEAFFHRRGLPVHELISCGFGARFGYGEGNHLEKYFEKKIPKSGNLNSFGEFLHALDTAEPDRFAEQLGTYLDIDNYLRYHALASILNHVDGFANNIYFYRPTASSPYQIIPWDFDKLLFPHHDVGLVGDNEIIEKLLRSDSCVAAYKHAVRQAISGPLDPASIFPRLEAQAARIADAHALDPWLGGAGIDLAVESHLLQSHLTRRLDFFRDHIESLTTSRP